MLENIQPIEVFRFFEEICMIPHGSGNIEEISNYLVTFAKERKLRYIQDELKNVIIWKEGSEGNEEKEPIIIQGHMDMVAVKKTDAVIDMEKEPLRLAVEDDFLYAKETSLGGDDGIALAYGLALLDSDDIVHPPLEVVFTVEEEVGMEGALGIDLSSLKGKMLLNIDSEKEGELTVSCAGGVRINGLFPIKRVELTEADLSKEYEIAKVKISGLKGGHSGIDIHHNRGNANILMGHLLGFVKKEIDFGLLSLEGGLKDNAIPRECEAELALNENEQEKFLKVLDEYDKILKEQLRYTDPDATVSVSFCKAKYSAMRHVKDDSFTTIIRFLASVPNGVQAMCKDMDNLVETSLNLGIISLRDTEFEAAFSLRSSVKSEKEALKDKITECIEALGGSFQLSGNYPAWEWKEDSKILPIAVDVYQALYQKEPVVLSIHAGLECGILADKIEGLDSVSIGPNMHDIHTTEERLSIASTQRVWEYIKALLEALCV